ncbi:uncharacterized protein LOC128235406 [Mya arenaria]|uniref:uncharacterized protein LOC128235406 n=1 Tax=Mya arenaria TaxID=6604 RepID=UPI0022E78A6A|nr:uncharacterized protein LOC128235406 [Mya arenaria]
MVSILFIGFALLFVGGRCDVCRDLDPTGCASLIAANSSLCQEEVFAYAACKRTCGLCPLTCYHCEDPLTDVRSCTATKLCEKGEQCMMSEVSSSRDGHREYRLNCASDVMCDGSMIFSPIGRRDISSHCCSVDLCNLPVSGVTTTTMAFSPTPSATKAPSCLRDIYILVEGFVNNDTTRDMLLSQFLYKMASALPADSRTSLARFDRDIHFLINFNDSAQILNLANNTGPLFNSHHSFLDYDRVMHDLINILQHQHNGAKANAVLLITNERSDERHHSHFHVQGSNFDGLASSVTVIDVGNRNPALASSFATDPNHEKAVTTYQGLMSIVPEVVSLLCS